MVDSYGRLDFSDWMQLVNTTSSLASSYTQMKKDNISMQDQADMNTYLGKYQSNPNWADNIQESDPDINFRALKASQKLNVEIETAKIDYGVKIMDKSYMTGLEIIGDATSGLDRSSNPDGSVKDETAYRYHYEKLLGADDLVNSQYDILKNRDGSLAVDWNNNKMHVTNHHTGETKWVDIPSLTTIKGYLGDIYEMKGNLVHKSNEGMKKYFDTTLQNKQDINKKNNERRAGAEIYKTENGDQIWKYKVQDPWKGGPLKMVYEDPVDNTKLWRGEAEGEANLKKGGYKTVKEKTTDLDQSLKKAKIKTEGKKEQWYQSGIDAGRGGGTTDKKVKLVMRALGKTEEEALMYVQNQERLKSTENTRYKAFLEYVEFNLPENATKEQVMEAADRPEFNVALKVAETMQGGSNKIEATGGISDKSTKKSSQKPMRRTPEQALATKFPEASDKTVKYLGQTKYVKEKGEWVRK